MLSDLLTLNIIGFIHAQGGDYALNFDGSNDYVSVNDNSSLTGTNAITGVLLIFLKYILI